MKCYKGFDKNMKCRDFQYESGKEYTEEAADICNCGFHACESPLEVFGYYAPGDQSRYCEVELDANDQKESDSKRVGKHIKIGAEIGIAGLVKAHLEYVNEKIEIKNANTGYRGASSNTGYRGASSNTGDYGASSNTGNCGASSNTGYRGSSEAGHPNSVAVAWGPEGKAKGVLGSFLVFAEWESNGGYHWLEDTWTFKGAQMVRVDGERIKEDTFYKLQNSEFVEVENE